MAEQLGVEDQFRAYVVAAYSLITAFIAYSAANNEPLSEGVLLRIQKVQDSYQRSKAVLADLDSAQPPSAAQEGVTKAKRSRVDAKAVDRIIKHSTAK